MRPTAVLVNTARGPGRRRGGAGRRARGAARSSRPGSTCSSASPRCTRGCSPRRAPCCCRTSAVAPHARRARGWRGVACEGAVAVLAGERRRTSCGLVTRRRLDAPAEPGWTASECRLRSFDDVIHRTLATVLGPRPKTDSACTRGIARRRGARRTRCRTRRRTGDRPRPGCRRRARQAPAPSRWRALASRIHRSSVSSASNCAATKRNYDGSCVACLRIELASAPSADRRTRPPRRTSSRLRARRSSRRRRRRRWSRSRDRRIRARRPRSPSRAPSRCTRHAASVRDARTARRARRPRRACRTRSTAVTTRTVRLARACSSPRPSSSRFDVGGVTCRRAVAMTSELRAR